MVLTLHFITPPYFVVTFGQLASNKAEEVSLGHILERAGNGEEAREAKKKRSENATGVKISLQASKIRQHQTMT